MATNNSVTVTGNVTADPEVRFTEQGTCSVNFGIAVNERFPNKQLPGEWIEKVSFFRVQVWGKRAENVETSVKKGHRVTVMGRLEQRRWASPDCPEGQDSDRSAVQIVADEVAMSLQFATAVVTSTTKSTGGSFVQEEPGYETVTPIGKGKK